MKVVILAGGKGTRLREETDHRPKPMVEIGGRPILWHIMKTYAHHGFTEFVVCLGYKGHVIRHYFLNFEGQHADVTLTLGQRGMDIHDDIPERGWKVTLAETGDGVADVDVTALVEHHRRLGRLATVTGVHPGSRYGELAIEDGVVRVFREKPQVHEGWINGGFFVFSRGVLDRIRGDMYSLEGDLLTELARENQLGVYLHRGFWQCMDTYREFQALNAQWESGRAPWAVWRHG